MYYGVGFDKRKMLENLALQISMTRHYQNRELGLFIGCHGDEWGSFTRALPIVADQREGVRTRVCVSMCVCVDGCGIGHYEYFMHSVFSGRNPTM